MKKAPAKKRTRRPAKKRTAPTDIATPVAPVAPVAPSPSPPVHVLTSNVTGEKMRAIEELSKAVHELAKALNSVNIDVRIENCHIDTATGPGISFRS